MDESKSFTEWNPISYLREYFPPNVDGEPAVQFIIEEKNRLNPNNGISLDLGCGPTVCYWAALADKFSQIDLADYLEANLRQQRLYVSGDKTSYDWSYYIKMILNYEGHTKVTTRDIEKRERLIRSRVRRLLRTDISKPLPLGTENSANYDCVISMYCADSITNNKRHWVVYMQNIFSLIKPGGTFIGSSMLNCDEYGVGTTSFPSVNLQAEDWHRLLSNNGFDMKSIRIEIYNESRQLETNLTSEGLRPEYDKVILVSGKLK